MGKLSVSPGRLGGLGKQSVLAIMLQAHSSVHTLLYDWMQPNPGAPHMDVSPDCVLWQAWLLGSAPDCAHGSAADDMRVAPLFKHVFPPVAAPSLAFIGLLFKSLRNTQFELQARPSKPLLLSAAAPSASPQGPITRET